MKWERNAQQSALSIQSFIVRITDPDSEMRQVWEKEMQEEHLAIARCAYELFETRGCGDGRDWEDRFRAELKLHLNE